MGGPAPVDPVDLLLGRLPDPVAPSDAHPVAPAPRVEHTAVFHDATPHDEPENSDWTFRPDEAHDPTPPRPVAEAAPEDEEPRPPRHRARIAPRVGAIVIVGVLVTGALAVTHIGPFRPSPGAAATLSTPADMPTNVRGVWSVVDTYGDVAYNATMRITTEDGSTGAFSGTITSPVGIETLKGKVIATAVSFTINLGTGTEQGSGVVSSKDGKHQIQATFSNQSGGHGTIFATRTSR